ncbi:MAG: C-GCAxxG-C-C family protein [Treponema sp.]|nr:C-GCAxxG-C-C family protein [Treponema sp.]
MSITDALKETHMESKGKFAAESVFNKGFNCAQAVLTSHCEEFGLSDEIAKKLSCGFGGGVGHTGGICGAVNGAIMLIGLKYGKYKKDDDESKDKTYKLVNQFINEFKNEFGSVNCTELVKFNLSKEDELLKAREAGVFTTVCPKLVKRSVEIAEKIILP